MLKNPTDPASISVHVFETKERVRGEKEKVMTHVFWMTKITEYEIRLRESTTERERERERKLRKKES